MSTSQIIAPERARDLTYVDIPRHVWDAVNHAVHTSSIDGNAMPISLCYVAVRAALKAYLAGLDAAYVEKLVPHDRP